MNMMKTMRMTIAASTANVGLFSVVWAIFSYCHTHTNSATYFLVSRLYDHLLIWVLLLMLMLLLCLR